MSLGIPHSPPTRWMQFKLWIHSENWIVATRSLSLSIMHLETFSQKDLVLVLISSQSACQEIWQSSGLGRASPSAEGQPHCSFESAPKARISHMLIATWPHRKQSKLWPPQQQGLPFQNRWVGPCQSGSTQLYDLSHVWGSSPKLVFPGCVPRLAAELCRHSWLHTHHLQYPLLLFSLYFTFQS